MFRGTTACILIYAMTLFALPPIASAQFTPAYPTSPSGQYSDPGSYASPPAYPPAPNGETPYGQTAAAPAQPGAYPPYTQVGPPYAQPGGDANSQDMTTDDAADQQHGVARLSIVQGDVNVRRGDNGELVAAIVNAPLMAQDHVQTAPGSRAEVQLDYANLLRLAPNTDIGFADLEYRHYQIQLAAGTISYRVLRNQDAQVEIETPSVAFRPNGIGEYRVSVLDDGTTQITVRSGSGQIFSPRGSEQLTAGRTTLVRGNPSDPEFQTTYEVARDQFDDWNANRDQELLRSQSYQHVSPDVYGAEDLDQYGRWVPSQYGQVWAPQPPTPDWAPYSYGQWDYEPYYGWTWVDYAPWGWAPYHYGRWFYNGGYGWCWWPGAFGARYFWRPALVGFYGFGTGLGWVALAPFEPFVGWWGRWGRGWYGYGGYRSVNVFANFRNANFRHGAIYAGYNNFGGPRQHFEFAGREHLMNATAFRGQIPVSPSRASYQFAARQAIANPRLASASNRQFFRTSFANGRPSSAFAAGTTGRFAQNNGGRYAPQAQPSTRANSSGWSRFGDPGGASRYRQNFDRTAPSARANPESGWHTFGQAQPSAPAYNGYRSNNPSGNYAPNYNRGYQNQRPGGFANGFTGGGNYNGPRYSAPAPQYSAPAAPRYSAPPVPQYSRPPSAPHYEAPSMPRYSAPSQHYSAPSFHGGGGSGSRGSGGGGGRSGGGGGHRR
jgi:FecR protein